MDAMILIDCNRLTNERLYESKDSREIEKGSISEKLLVVLEDTFDELERRGQKLFFSGGDGYHYSQICFIPKVFTPAYW